MLRCAAVGLILAFSTFAGLTPAGATQAGPVGLKLVASKPTSLTVAWAKQTGAVKYTLKYSPYSSHEQLKYVTVQSNTATIAGLVPGHPYYMAVLSYSSSGARSTYSAWFKGSTKLYAPTKFRVSGSGRSALALAWTKSTGASAYELRYGTRSDGVGAATFKTGNQASATISSLIAGSTYFLDISAVSKYGVRSAFTARIKAATKSGNLGTDRLTTGKSLEPGNYIRSANGRYRLVMQGDGNLVEYDDSAKKVMWAAFPPGGRNLAVMQGDGNFVVYRQSGGPAIWSANTAGFNDATLILQNDGNLVIYKSLPVWASGEYLGGRLASGWTMGSNVSRFSPNKRYWLVMQGDGNLVLYDRSNNNRALWDSRTSGKNHVVMQGDGNLVVYRDGGAAQWDSKTAGKTGARLEVQDDGNLVIYQGGTAVWDRNNGSTDVPGRNGWAFPIRPHSTLTTYSGHGGDDFSAGAGTPIYAMKGGTATTEVVSAAAIRPYCPDWAPVNGDQLQVRITSSVGGASYEIAYAHMSRFEFTGTRTVQDGQLIGYVGQTGCATGPHLHVGAKRNGVVVYPRDLLGTTSY